KKLVFIAQDATHSPDLYLAERQAGRPWRDRRLTQLNPTFDRYVWGQVRIIEWHAIDGETLHGVLLLPAGYLAGRRYPLVTKIYGGVSPSDHGSDLFGEQLTLVDNLQLLATRGYAVFLPDIPLRSDGTVVLDLLKEVMPGIEKTIELGIADPQRLGLMGH